MVKQSKAGDNSGSDSVTDKKKEKKTKYLLTLTPRGGRRFASGSSSSCCVVGRMGENLINFGRILMLIPSK